MKDIRLSPSHGVNPSLEVCFLCQKDTGTISLMGRMRDDAQAPHKMTLNKEPCDECKKLMSMGVILISTKNGESGDNPYRTGGWCAIKEEAVQRMVSDTNVLASILKSRVAFLPDEVWDLLGLPRGEVEGIPSEVKDVHNQ